MLAEDSPNQTGRESVTLWDNVWDSLIQSGRAEYSARPRFTVANMIISERMEFGCKSLSASSIAILNCKVKHFSLNHQSF
jgi:hypothetical protein